MKMDRRLSALKFIGLLVALAINSVCWGQFNPLFLDNQTEEADPVLSQLRRLPRDPLASTSLFRANAAIENGDLSGGLEALQSLLNETSDFFLLDGLKIDGSMRDQIEETIAAHLEDYERLFGNEASQLYEQALAGHNAEQLGEVVRRFRLTRAGQLATAKLAQLTFDRGDVEAAARTLSTYASLPPSANVAEAIEKAAVLMARSGHPDRARARIRQFEGKLDIPVETMVESIPQPVFRAKAEAELFDWLVPHGGTSHGGHSSFAPALFADAWKQPLIDEFDFFLGDIGKEQALLKDAQEMARVMESRVWSQSDRSAFPAGRPLIVGNRVIVPGYGTTKSYNLETGELDGVGVNVDQSFEYLHEYTAAPSLMNDSFREEVRALFFALRGWRDLSSASLSSDGKYVYAVSDCQLVGSVAPEYLQQSSQRHELLPQPFNQLFAFELDAGMRNRWAVGTVAENAFLQFDQEENVNREIFFYGAPLPVADQLFVIGEERGQIQLYEIDRETGAVLWSVGLLNPDKKITLDEVRRLSGIMPAYVDGLLICPTGEGVITAVDPLSRKVIWSHQYGKSRQIVLNRFMFRRGMRSRGQTVTQSIERLLGDDRWFDVKVISAGNYIVHTPPDSDELVCINIQDGTTVWKDPMFRLRSLYVAGVEAGHLIVVGRSEVAAVRMEDGSRVWNCPIPRPSGRGVCMEGRFLQPLMTGEIAVIDLERGHQLARTPLPGGRVIGNLVSAHERLVAQSGTEIIGFQSASDIESLIAKTEEADSKSALLGELQLQQGKVASGIAALESIPQERRSSRAQGVLAWAKLDQLQHDFKSHQQELNRIEQLMTTDEQRFRFLRAKASGLESLQDFRGAFQGYLDLFANRSGTRQLRDFDGLQEVSDQRWALAQLEEIISSIDTGKRQDFESELNKWLEKAPDDESVLEFLRAIPLRYLSPLTAIRRLISIEATAENLPAMSCAYERLKTIDHPEVAARACRELALISLQFKNGSAAQAYLDLLDNQAVIPVDMQVAATEVVRNIREDERWSEALNSVPVWPAKVQESDDQSPMAKSSRHQIPLIGPGSAALNGWTFFLNPMGSQIDVYDEHGQRQCRLGTGIVSPRFPIGSTLARYVSVRGHLALIVLADRFLLVDFQEQRNAPRDVLRQTLITEDQNPYGTDSFVNPDQRPEPGFRTFRSLSPIGTPAGNVGPIGASTLCFGLSTQLTAVDPLTGRTVWKRHDLSPGSEIFSDDEYVLTLAPGEQVLHVYRASDGTEIGTRDLPENSINSVFDRENGDWGRYFPVVNETETSFEFALIDPVNDEVLWSFKGPLGTLWTTVDRQDIAFLTPDKTFSIMNAMTGERLLQKVIPVGNEVESLTVLTRQDHWIVLPGSGTPLQYNFSYPSLITRTIEKTVDGTIVAIDRKTGDQLWTYDIEDQQTTTEYPTAWPILFFGKAAGRDVQGLVLNSLTGEEVVKQGWPYDRTWIHWQASVQPTQIRIGYGRQTLNLDCVEPLTN